MGRGKWDCTTSKQYLTYSNSIAATTSHREVFRETQIHESLNPTGITIRESCDSDENPTSNAIIIGLDVTGSMGNIAHHIAKEGLGTLMTEIMEREPVVNPHIMFMAIGDAHSDRAPLQVSQFEPDIRIVEQLANIFVEGNGGGNESESYDLPWYFAANHTTIDCFNKRQKKGYLFTMGDEMPPEYLTSREIETIFGNRPQVDKILSADSLKLAQEQYHVFHLIIEDGSFARRHGQRVLGAWSDILGTRALPVFNHQMVPQVILSAIQVSEGMDPEEVIVTWQDPSVAKVVRRALGA